MFAPMHAKHQERPLGAHVRHFGAGQHRGLPLLPYPLQPQVAPESRVSQVQSPAKLNHHSVRLPLKVIFKILRGFRRPIGANRRLQFVTPLQHQGGGSGQVPPIDQYIQIAGRPYCQVAVSGGAQYNAFERHSRNPLAIEGSEDGEQLRCVGEAVKHVALVREA